MANAPLGNPQNLVIPQGRFFECLLRGTTADGSAPIPLPDGFTAAAVIKAYANDNAPILETFEATIFDGPDGVVRLALTAEQTAGLKRNGVYDVKVIDPDGVPYDFLNGNAIIRSRVTE